MTGTGEISRLVGEFRDNLDRYRDGEINETQVRREFIDPFFKALGWDVDNRKGHPPGLKEVRHEDSIKVSGSTKAPDYGFYLGSNRHFFVEAKKPSITLKDSPGPAVQLRRYAWSANLPVSVLTDFEEFAVYNSRIRPNLDDGPEVARLLYCTFEDYPNRWGELTELLSPAAVRTGSLQEIVEADPETREGEPVDDAFLEDLENWRRRLAVTLKDYNPTLSAAELNYAVQILLDRIVFLRIAEDRGIEPHGKLLRVTEANSSYNELQSQFIDADHKYDSGLFHFGEETSRPDDTIDTLTPGLNCPDDLICEIVESLYFPKSPFEFAVLPSDILGQTYERFLARVITTDDGSVDVRKKPELRKTEGVYYTPGFIVDYIVDQSLQPYLERYKPGPRGGVSDIAVLDPACGSGSFLVAAYERLLEWHLSNYVDDDPDRWSTGGTPRIYEGPGNEWRLTIKEKKRILLNNIYGVDKDSQAVEITKLSLLLKMLEGETEETLSVQLPLFGGHVLPELNENIKCGNSIIGTEYSKNRQDSFLEDNGLYEVNPFDWNTEFPGVLGESVGFDVIIGNPPYRRERDYKQLLDRVAETAFGKKYRSPRMDLWYYFAHRALDLLSDQGRFSFIVNSYWLKGTGASKLISRFKEEVSLEEIFALDDLSVFPDVSGRHLVFLASKDSAVTSTRIRRVPDDAEGSAGPYVNGFEPVEEYSKPHLDLFRAGSIDIEPSDDGLLATLERHDALSDLAKVGQGIAENPPVVSESHIEEHGEDWTVGSGVFALTDDEVEDLSLSEEERGLLRPYYALQDLGRYYIAEEPSYKLIYSSSETWQDPNRNPGLKEHLEEYKPIMDERRETKKGTRGWWQLHWPRSEDMWESDKVVCVQMAVRPSFVPIHGPAYVSFSATAIIPNEETEESVEYIAGVLNSRVLWKWFQHNAKRRGVNLEINVNVLNRAPIPRINFNAESEVELHDRITRTVKEQVELRRRLEGEEIPSRRATLERQIKAGDQTIDETVTDLFGLTEEQIQLVSDSVSS